MDITKEFKTNEFLHWFVISSLSGIEVTEELKSIPRLVTMQINGVEVDPIKALNDLEKHYMSCVTDLAHKIVDSMMYEHFEPVIAMLSNIKSVTLLNSHESIKAKVKEMMGEEWKIGEE